MSGEKILIVDDEANARNALREILEERGYEIAEAADGEDALARIDDVVPAVVLADVRMPRMDGVTLLKRAREKGCSSTFVMMTAFATVQTAVDAMMAGAEDVLVKPLDPEAVLTLVDKVLKKRRWSCMTHPLRRRTQEAFSTSSIAGDSPAFKAAFEVIHRAAPSRAAVLLLGEPGTGKELLARALHELSPRREKPFVTVRCAALAEDILERELFGVEGTSQADTVETRDGRVELADGGTLFLDEIGELPPSSQARLLRLVNSQELERVGGAETIRVDVRVVAATNQDLPAKVKAGRFSEGLYHRLSVVSVTLPPLRQRLDDLPALVSHFIDQYAGEYGKEINGLAPGTMQALLACTWPGNVRELEQVIEHAVVLCTSKLLSLDDLPATFPRSRPAAARPAETGAVHLPPGARLYDIEREAILRTIKLAGGSTSKAADILNISVRKIQYRLKEYAALDQRQSTS